MPMISMPDFDKVEIAPPSLDAGIYEGNIVEKPEPGQSESPDGPKPYLLVTVQVTNGPVQSKPHPVTGSNSAEGRTISNRVYLTKAAAWRMKALLVCAGLLDRADQTSPLAKGQINSDMLLGCRVKFEAKKRMSDGNEYTDIQWIV